MPQRLLESLDVPRMPMLRRDHLRQIEREAICVVELERIIARNNRLVTELLHPRESAFDRLEKAPFFGAGYALDVRLLGHELGIDVPYRRRDCARQRREGRLAPSQQPGGTHGAAENASPHVTPPLVPRLES